MATTAIATDLMPIEHIDDWEQRIARHDAFWDCAIIDRPVAVMTLRRKNPDYPPPPAKQYSQLRDRWLDAEHVAQRALHDTMNTLYLGDALPTAWPNLGPEVFSAYFGTEMEYGEGTSWSIPSISDWDNTDHVKFFEDNFYWKKTKEMTDALLEVGKGKFYTGYTDLHPGGDCLAAFRDPLNLNIDMIDNLDHVKSMREKVDDVFIQVFNYYVDYLQGHGQAITTWAGPVSTRRWHVPSNDFSCMISKEMFDDTFLPGVARECRNAEASMYHLDGPNALKHLDSLLEIPELNAIQWICGAGNGRATDWFHIYQKCQAAGKGIQLSAEADEIDAIIENLKPEGVWLWVSVKSEEQADEALKKLCRWR